MHSNEYRHFKWFIYLMFGAKVALDKATKLGGAMYAKISRTQCGQSSLCKPSLVCIHAPPCTIVHGSNGQT